MVKKDPAFMVPREWAKINRLAAELSQALRKAVARENLRQLREKYTQGRSLIKPAGKPGIGKKRIQKAVKNSRN